MGVRRCFHVFIISYFLQNDDRDCFAELYALYSSLRSMIKLVGNVFRTNARAAFNGSFSVLTAYKDVQHIESPSRSDCNQPEILSK